MAIQVFKVKIFHLLGKKLYYFDAQKSFIVHVEGANILYNCSV